jgi:hypothetical protein
VTTTLKSTRRSGEQAMSWYLVNKKENVCSDFETVELARHYYGSDPRDIDIMSKCPEGCEEQ